MKLSRLINQNVISSRGRTSVRLEPELWAGLDEISLREKWDRRDAVRAVQAAFPGQPLTSSIRTFVFQYFRQAAREVASAEMSAAGFAD